MKIGIDASNIRHGGGVTHLVELLTSSYPLECGIKEVTVWGGAELFEHLPSRAWLNFKHVAELDKSLLHRLVWQKYKLPKEASAFCSLLFVPGGLVTGDFKPTVTMSQNILPFDIFERQRFGYSWTNIRLNLLRYGQKRSFHNANGTIFLTDYAKDLILKNIGGVSGLTATIPHGISSRFRMEPRKQEEAIEYSSERPFRWVYVSVIDLYKHQWNVAAAVHSLKRLGMPISLDLIGGVKNKAAYHKLQKELSCISEGKPYINYCEEVPFSDLHSSYHSADAFVFASSCENLPNILIEAMAAGLPIICSNRGPMPEVLGDAGLYFDPEDVESIKVVMRKLLLDTGLRQDCAEAAFRKSLQYSWESCANKTWRFLSKVERHWRHSKSNKQEAGCVEFAE